MKKMIEKRSEVENPAESRPVLLMTSDIVSSFVSHNNVAIGKLPQIIRDVHHTLDGLSASKSAQPKEKPKPAVPIEESITRDHLICLEDGRKLKMLKRYLRSAFGMSPKQYRERWNLPADYPMVAPNYSKTRSPLAKDTGLGKSRR